MHSARYSPASVPHLPPSISQRVVLFCSSAVTSRTPLHSPLLHLDQSAEILINPFFCWESLLCLLRVEVPVAQQTFFDQLLRAWSSYSEGINVAAVTYALNQWRAGTILGGWWFFKLLWIKIPMLKLVPTFLESTGDKNAFQWTISSIHLSNNL